MTTSIFVRSYRADRFWLDYLLRSLQKFATGFSETVVCLPIGDEPHFEKTDFHGARVVWVQDPDAHPYCSQQVSKIEADSHCSADGILYLDSDCFLTAPMRPEMFCMGGKPIQLIRHWSSLDENSQQWREITNGMIGFTPVFEHMACHPMIFDRRTLPLLREVIQHTHKKPLREYVCTITDRKMSEFNALGAVAHRYQPFLYDWRIAYPEHDGYPRIVKQQWSYQEGGVSRHEAEYERILAA
ncbi:MAG: DUF6492 family protein [Collimonas pratensis]|uniref:DUF6492 family protein n=1 Tax=Collimonas pratensis TaxID=279113 RepID=UPI003C715CED